MSMRCLRPSESAKNGENWDSPLSAFSRARLAPARSRSHRLAKTDGLAIGGSSQFDRALELALPSISDVMTAAGI